MKYEVINKWNDIDFGGSAMVGQINIPYRKLVAMLGEPTQVNGDRIQERWLIKFADGMVATIFSDKKCEDGEWLIGGFGKYDKKTKENLHVRAVKELFGL